MKYSKEVMRAIRQTKEFDNESQLIVFFVLGIVFGVFGNLVANGLWEFFPTGRLAFFAIAVLILGLVAYEVIKQRRRIAYTLCQDKVIPFSFNEPKSKNKPEKSR
ncbi:MAG: hypothetical protein HOE11_00180 [Candidatus Diapherotrites archaeon]|jgi:hypothetical protein|nr:hypothetical protein [Candidatus Diapherotrites archaeon]MBT4597386.1 hypothetical protein [Candidatus Diapherotrites archaeon]